MVYLLLTDKIARNLTFSTDIVAIYFSNEVVGISTTASVLELLARFTCGVIVITGHRRRAQSFIFWAIA